MQTFLNQVAGYVYENYADNTDQLCIVLPNKRGALFLKKQLAQTFKKTIWLPSIISAEELIETLAGTQSISEIDLLCKLYESYRAVVTSNTETFDSFAKWGNLILQDFNEIDRYLADANALYSNLRDIKEIESWSLAQEELSDFQKNYIDFMGKLGSLYSHFTASLLQENKAYQGLVYRMAVTNYEQNVSRLKFSKIIFCGFNALNKAETIIFKRLHESGKAEMLWDADRYYMDNDVQEAGLFLRKNKQLFNCSELHFTDNFFKEAKHVDIIAVPRQIGQAQSIQVIVNKLLDEGKSPDSIAIVLANEKLLWPVLKLLPERIEHVNITMEYPLKYTSPYNFIDLLLKVQISYEKQTKNKEYVYYTDFLELVRHSFFKEYAAIVGIEDPGRIINRVLEHNYAFINQKLISELFGEKNDLIQPVFTPWLTSINAAKCISGILNQIKEYNLGGELTSNKSVELEYLEVLIRNFNRVNDIISCYPYFDSVKSLKILFNQVVGAASASFLGEPLKGLQVMGVLETRTLDFENVIFVSVNEGVLPSGKSVNSFIPNDLKRFYGLPLYGEKDAIYAYHFYRFLQRAKNSYILYDTEADTFGKGEKSRFVSQLQYEWPVYNPDLRIREYIAQSTAVIETEEQKITIQKDNFSLQPIIDKACSDEEYKALSPSSLITYKDCPLKFYFRYGAGLKEAQSVEESAEANTFGSILHEVLELLYKPFIKNELSEKLILTLKNEVKSAVETCFLRYFSEAEAYMGKNLLQQNVLNIYAVKLITFDAEEISKSARKKLTLLHLEKELCSSVQVNFRNETIRVYIKGKADRIDDYDGNYRIIDYKSSVSDNDKFEFESFDSLFKEKKFDKMLQLFFYAWLAWKNKLSEPEALKPCIIPFKVFEEEPIYITKGKFPLQFTNELLCEFETHLSQQIAVILNEAIPFNQTEDKDVCKYCAYAVVCNRQ